MSLASVITAISGNIVRQPDCDAIVNSANPNLRAGSGVCGAIYRAAGPELEPYSKIMAPLSLAQCVITPGFKLPNQWIIHCRGPRYHFDPDPAANLRLCMENLILAAASIGVVRLAVPAVSMGVYAYPPEEAVPILVKATQDTLPHAISLQEIRFVLMQDNMLELFQQAIKSKEA